MSLQEAQQHEPVQHSQPDMSAGNNRLKYILTLGALVALGPFTIDLYLPAFPLLAADLNTSETAVQLTLTGTILGFALGQLLIGPLSDAIGRRIPLLITVGIHIAASLACAFAPTIEILAASRFLQGLGAAGSGVVAMAMVRDLYSGRPMVTMLSRMALVSGLAPIVAPLLGSQLLLITNWRGIFGFLVGYGVAMFIVTVIVLRETRPVSVRIAEGPVRVRSRYGSVLRDRRFIGVVLIGGFNFSALMAYLSSSTFLFQDVYGFSQQGYGVLFAVNSIAVLLGTQTTGRLSRTIAPQWILAFSTGLMTVSASVLLLCAGLGAGVLGVIIPLWFFILGVGLSFPCIQVLALANHPAEAGTAASLLGAVNFGSSGLVPPIIGMLGSTSSATMGVVMVVCSVVSVGLLWSVVRPRSVPAVY